jgi:NAD(P)-dependent dehydrogenase (short-subunit alcohol dehydrogenase family)
MSKTVLKNPSDRKAYIVTGPTSGIGLSTALELAKRGVVVLVGRDKGKLNEMEKTIEKKGQHAVSVVCDLSDPASVLRAVAEITALRLPIVGLLNNAGIMQMRATKNALGWDMTFATNHLGPFALTEALIPHLSDGTHVVFVCSGVEDPSASPPRWLVFVAVATSLQKRARAASGNPEAPRCRARMPTLRRSSAISPQ